MPSQHAFESDVQIPLLDMYSETEDKKGSDELKGQELVENVSESSTMAMDDDPVYSRAEQRAIIHRVDRRLVATCGLIYCFSLIDRGNLDMITPDVNDILTEDIQGFGFVDKWTTILGLRVILGVLEAGLYPSIVYLLATWYSRYDVGKRYAAFYVIGCIALAFGGILAYGLMQMGGLAGKAGWRWIFIMEGLLTCIVAGFAYFLLVDFPEKAHKSFHFLNVQERDFIIRRVNKDRDDALPEPFTLARFLKPGLDFKLWILALISLYVIRNLGKYSMDQKLIVIPLLAHSFIITVSTAISVFLPIILRTNMGFSIAYALAIILMIASAYIGDKFHIRGPILIANSLISLTGLPIMAFASRPAARYFGVFLVTAGVNANIPTALAYQANNVRGQWKRALCSAMFVAFGGIGGISGGTIFRAQDAPRYIPGIVAAIV
ncbi:MAG: hypothetical protein Q9220_002664 [cf. Caloplaca sp. 1 TL-2023]